MLRFRLALHMVDDLGIREKISFQKKLLKFIFKGENNDIRNLYPVFRRTESGC